MVVIQFINDWWTTGLLLSWCVAYVVVTWRAFMKYFPPE